MGAVLIWSCSLSQSGEYQIKHFYLGSSLLPTQPVNDISQYVEKGYRMDAPDGCPDAVYSVMKECWEADPAKRPNFTRIMKALDSVS